MSRKVLLSAPAFSWSSGLTPYLFERKTGSARPVNRCRRELLNLNHKYLPKLKFILANTVTPPAFVQGGYDEY